MLLLKGVGGGFILEGGFIEQDIGIIHYGTSMSKDFGALGFGVSLARGLGYATDITVSG